MTGLSLEPLSGNNIHLFSFRESDPVTGHFPGLHIHPIQSCFPNNKLVTLLTVSTASRIGVHSSLPLLVMTSNVRPSLRQLKIG